MNYKPIFAIIVFVAAIIAAQPVGIYFPIIVQEIEPDGNGYDVVAQTVSYADSGKIVCISIDPDYVNAPNINAVIVHEFGHVNHPEWDEAQCDDWANSIVDGPDVVDAYHGIH